MGLHNRITQDKYDQIKETIKANDGSFTSLEKLDSAMASVYGISVSSARNIRLTKDYQAYCERVFRFHGHPKTESRVTREIHTFKAVTLYQMELERRIENIEHKLWFYFVLDIIVLIILLALVDLIIWSAYGN